MRALCHILPAALSLALAGCYDRGDEAEPFDVMPHDLAPPDLSGCVEGPTAASSTGPQIRFTTMDVDRRFIQVRSGEAVTWTNGDTVVHTVTAGEPEAVLPDAAGGFDSGDMAPGARWAYRFCAPRQTLYFCRTHPAQMRGYFIVVTP